MPDPHLSSSGEGQNQRRRQVASVGPKGAVEWGLNLSSQALATSACAGSVPTDLSADGETARCPRGRCRLLTPPSRNLPTIGSEFWSSPHEHVHAPVCVWTTKLLGGGGVLRGRQRTGETPSSHPLRAIASQEQQGSGPPLCKGRDPPRRAKGLVGVLVLLKPDSHWPGCQARPHPPSLRLPRKAQGGPRGGFWLKESLI